MHADITLWQTNVADVHKGDKYAELSPLRKVTRYTAEGWEHLPTHVQGDVWLIRIPDHIGNDVQLLCTGAQLYALIGWLSDQRARHSGGDYLEALALEAYAACKRYAEAIAARNGVGQAVNAAIAERDNSAPRTTDQLQVRTTAEILSERNDAPSAAEMGGPF